MNTIQTHADLVLIMTFVEYKPVPAYGANSTVSKRSNLHPKCKGISVTLSVSFFFFFPPQQSIKGILMNPEKLKHHEIFTC